MEGIHIEFSEETNCESTSQMLVSIDQERKLGHRIRSDTFKSSTSLFVCPRSTSIECQTSVAVLKSVNECVDVCASPCPDRDHDSGFSENVSARTRKLVNYA